MSNLMQLSNNIINNQENQLSGKHITPVAQLPGWRWRLDSQSASQAGRNTRDKNRSENINRHFFAKKSVPDTCVSVWWAIVALVSVSCDQCENTFVCRNHLQVHMSHIITIHSVKHIWWISEMTAHFNQIVSLNSKPFLSPPIVS